MTTKLDSPLKRELNILGKLYTLTLSPDGLNLAPKGRRKGYELAWADFVSGEAALDAFRWLIEELKVSLFAQELRTPVPVSYKRLEKAWKELSSS